MSGSTPPPEVGGDSHTAVASAPYQLFDGETLCLSEPNGDVTGVGAQGLFTEQQRVISRLTLTVNGQPTTALGFRSAEPFSGTFISRAATGSGPADSGTIVTRHRAVAQGCVREDLEITNHRPTPVTLTMALEVATDATALTDVRSGVADTRPPPRQHVWRGEGRERGAIRLAPESEGTGGILLEIAPGAGERPGTEPIVDPERGRLTFLLRLEPQQTWRTGVNIHAVRDGTAVPTPFPFGRPVNLSAPARRLQQWRRQAAVVTAGPTGTGQVLTDAVSQSVTDLGALRLSTVPTLPTHAQQQLPPAAGAPWFMYLFGRDALLAGMMALPIHPDPLLASVHTLAALQGERVDPVTEEAPGNFPHRVRHDPGGHPRYYGAADVPPLFVAAVGELYRWGYGDRVRDLLPHVDRALDWIEQYGDRDGDGFVEYHCPPESFRRLRNQSWRDSDDSMSFADGKLAQTPIAAASVQGYVYAAYLARADIADAEGDPQTAAGYRERATRFQRSFHDTFWLPEQSYYALALDKDKRQLDVVSSDAGHLLWTGVVADQAVARVVADRLMSPELFTGFGFRTLSPQSARYNPARYHTGPVWPHDTAIGAAGLARYGFDDYAMTVATGLLSAAAALPDRRLPELLCGFDRDQFPTPVSYPGGCNPQLWGAAVAPQLVRTCLGLEPDAPHGRLRWNPRLPDGVSELTVRGVSLGSQKIGLSVRRGKGDALRCTISGAADLTVVEGPLFGDVPVRPPDTAADRHHAAAATRDTRATGGARGGAAGANPDTNRRR